MAAINLVADIADQVAVLQRGVLAESGPRDAVLNAPQHPYTKALFAAVPGAGWAQTAA